MDVRSLAQFWPHHIGCGTTFESCFSVISTSLGTAAAMPHSDNLLHDEREWLRVTLSSIGDAVITTDTSGGVTFLNPVAEALTGWSLGESLGVPLETVFKIVNEETRRIVESPACASACAKD